MRYCISSSNGFVLSLSAGVPELGQFHAMSVMEWTNVTTTTGEQVELIRIRNPWGRKSWAGVWRERYGGKYMLNDHILVHFLVYFVCKVPYIPYMY